MYKMLYVSSIVLLSSMHVPYIMREPIINQENIVSQKLYHFGTRICLAGLKL